MFVLDFLALERSQAAQREIEDRLRLQLRQPELLHQAGPRALGVLRSANQLDNRVQILQRDEQAVEDVQARLSFLQFESRAAREHNLAMLEERHQHLQQRHLLGPALVDAEQDDAVALLHLGQLVELVEDYARLGVALEFDDGAHAVAIGLVADVADTLDAFLVHELGHPIEHASFVHLVGDFANDDRRPRAALVGLDGRQSPHGERAAAGKVRLSNCLASEQLPASRKIRTRYDIEDFLVR